MENIESSRIILMDINFKILQSKYLKFQIFALKNLKIDIGFSSDETVAGKERISRLLCRKRLEKQTEGPGDMLMMNVEWSPPSNFTGEKRAGEWAACGLL